MLLPALLDLLAAWRPAFARNRSHHRAVHRIGDEQAWWTQTGIDPIKVARKLWKHSRIDEGRIDREPMAEEAAPDRASATDGDAVPGSHAHPDESEVPA